MFTLKDLRNLVAPLQEVLGSYWTIKVYTAKECAEVGTFDPPCAFLEATCAMGTLRLTVDGEIDTDDGSDGNVASKKTALSDIVAFLAMRG